MRYLHKDTTGFSLVELSIVLVILGLLVGGVLSGQSLIHAAELRSISSDYARFDAAEQSFRDKYFALPGDMTNATKFWGQSSNCPGLSTQGTTDGTTCDGNGDGMIFQTGGVSNPTANEVWRFWQHLTNAGLIEGAYNGVTADPAKYYWSAGTSNAPISRIPSAYWSATYGNNAAGAFTGTLFWREFRPHMFLLGGLNAGAWNSIGILTPSDAWNVDTKMDDGMPGAGKVMGKVTNNCTTAATGADTSSTYMLNQTGKNCILAMMP